jgi:hypothetical protein
MCFPQASESSGGILSFEEFETVESITMKTSAGDAAVVVAATAVAATAGADQKTVVVEEKSSSSTKTTTTNVKSKKVVKKSKSEHISVVSHFDLCLVLA